jgi:HlyD family secretion protein
MFRIRAKIDPGRLRLHAEEVRSGLPGETYLLLDSATAWPARLQGSAAP